MAEKREQKDKLGKRLRVKYRMVIMNDETFQEKFSLLLSPMNVIVLGGSLAIFLVVSVTYIIAFTSLREYIPGYADINMRRQVYGTAMRLDSLERAMLLKDQYLENLQMVIAGKLPETELMEPDTTKDYTVIEFSQSRQDSLLRTLVEEEERYNLRTLQLSAAPSAESNVRNLFFFAPIKGDISAPFDPRSGHVGIDVVTRENEAVKSTLDGTVVIATWTYDAGYVIAVQHSSNLMSFYKHNSVLLKKQGDAVKAGEVLAIVGNTGELTSGPHLHFELWLGGRPVNPEEYVVF
ncbi:MAG: M23 family metallopeptidase [Flavobacteriales bacterium]|nr:M23 family metallopeptidase [Flavobacteriales bacterium]